ncbi:MAG: S26 family signal peptidase [Clostridiales bacterium]|nr:S26 family signal peptidase [Clostridiales bacterium]
MKRLILPGRALFPLVEEFLSKGLWVVFTVTGVSMWPLIRHGHDSVRLVGLDRAPRRGDLVLLKVPPPHKKYVLHRVYRVEGDLLVTLGDCRLTLDPMVPVDSVIGRAEAVLRKGRELRCDSLLWRAYAWVWLAAFPVRRPLLMGLLRLSRLKRRLRKGAGQSA